MKIFTSKAELSGYISNVKQEGKSIGFVPTMGALHQGHLSLLGIAAQQTDVVICSIFVNPTQFNDPQDLEKYPRPVEEDIRKLEESNCDVLFLPAVNEMYAQAENWHIELGYLEDILEGKFRPGHYQGVTQIVKKLFDVVCPDKAFFGQKDFQQVKVIEKMVRMFNMPVDIIMCPILREQDGLAMSSRNVHLSPQEKQAALALSASLFLIRDKFGSESLDHLTSEAVLFLEKQPVVELEYFEIRNADTLLEARSKSEAGIVALVAARVGKTRLIDNIILK